MNSTHTQTYEYTIWFTPVWLIASIVLAVTLCTIFLGVLCCRIVPRWRRQRIEKASNLIVEEDEKSIKIYKKNNANKVFDGNDDEHHITEINLHDE